MTKNLCLVEINLILLGSMRRNVNLFNLTLIIIKLNDESKLIFIEVI